MYSLAVSKFRDKIKHDLKSIAKRVRAKTADGLCAIVSPRTTFRFKKTLLYVVALYLVAFMSCCT